MDPRSTVPEDAFVVFVVVLPGFAGFLSFLSLLLQAKVNMAAQARYTAP
jgi:hypothetical protein